MAHELDVSSKALDLPDIDSNVGLLHTFFALEDLRGLQVSEIDGEICLKLDKSKDKIYEEMHTMLSAWLEQSKRLEAGEIIKEEYDTWRYNYPKFDITQKWAKVPSQGLSDFLLDGLKKY